LNQRKRKEPQSTPVFYKTANSFNRILNKKIMDFNTAIFCISFLLPFPFMAGYIAQRFGRSFWFWFLLSIPLPFVSCFILLCFPDKSVKEIPVESKDIFKWN